MASLIVEHEGHRKGGQLQGRVVIGRRENSHLRIPDRSVSRIHAWIGETAGQYFIADCGSRVGTNINGKVLRGRKTLEDGDEIRIGSARMKKFLTSAQVPDGAEPLDLSEHQTESDDGIFIDCPCGAPLWAPWDFAGRVGQCRYCGQFVEMPKIEGRTPFHDPSNDTVSPGVSQAPDREARGLRISVPKAPERPRRQSIFDAPLAAPAPPAAPQGELRLEPELLCGACQLAISLLEETHKCSECGVTLHAECWTENRGCSSYGCTQVGILDPDRDKPKVAGPDPLEAEAWEDQNLQDAHAEVDRHSSYGTEWEYAFLPLSLAATLLGLLCFGVPPLLVALWAWAYRRRRWRVAHPVLLAFSLAVSLLGIAGGVAFSWYWWLNSAGL